MYDARAVAEAIRQDENSMVELGTPATVAGTKYEEDEVVICEVGDTVELGKAGEPEAHFMIRTSDGRTWRVCVDEHFV